VQQRWMAAAVAASALLAVGAGGPRVTADGGSSPRPGEIEPATVSAYEPVGPCRAIDTRTSGRLAAGATLTVDLSPCNPPADIVAAVLTVTAVHPAGPGYATVFPAGSARPDTSLLNWPGAGAVVANTGIVQVGHDPARGPAVAVYTLTAVDLVVDVSGYFVVAPHGKAAAGRFVPLALPTRVLDTRTGKRPAPQSAVTVELPDDTVPADATAVLVNVTATESTGASHITAWPGGERPVASILNVDGPDQTRAATTIVGITDGTFQLYTHRGEQLVVDLIGYFTGRHSGWSKDGLFVPLNPTRQLDTRASSKPIYPSGTVEATHVTGAVFVGNVTITETTQAGYLRVLPARVGSSAVSSVNADRRGSTSANLVVTPVSEAGVAVWSRFQSDAVLDQTGYFTGTRPKATEAPGLNLPDHVPSYPTAACAAHDPRLSYDRQPGAPAPREVRQIGTSHEGRPIWAEYYGPYQATTTVLVVAAVHGDECGPALVVDAARRTGSASTTAGYWIVPVLNPDGLAAFSRYNAAGEDINRDGYRMAQPESLALMSFTTEVRPALTLHVHSPYGFVGGFGPDPRAYAMAAGIAWATGMTKATTAGTKPGHEFLWEGQMLVHPHAVLLAELFPVLRKEATVDRPRIPPRPVAEVAEDATQIMAVIQQYFG